MENALKIVERLKQLSLNQQEISQEYETLIKEYNEMDLLKENEALRGEATKYKALFLELQDKHQQVVAQKNKLEIALKDQMMNEKVAMTKLFKQKLMTYFEMPNAATNLLDAIEMNTKVELNKLVTLENEAICEESLKMTDEINQLRARCEANIASQRSALLAKTQEFKNQVGGQIDQLASQPIDQKTMEKRIKQNNLEVKVGLNWMNKIGIVVLIIGLITFMQFSYSTWFNDYMKGIFSMLVGLVFVLGGELSIKKGKAVFGKGVVGGGVGILYLAIFYSYFGLNIIALEWALAFAIINTALAFVLALRYQSRTIGALALMGGYLPLVSYALSNGIEGIGVYIGIGYVGILTLLALFIALYKNWTVLHYLSYGLHFFVFIYFLVKSPSAIVSILYTLGIFVIYLGMTLIYPFKKTIPLGKGKVALLTVNTLVSCVSLYTIILSQGWDEVKGLLAIGFCIVYTVLASWIKKYLPNEKATVVVFYSTALTFSILIVPFQFGMRWMTLGWIVEGTLLLVYALKIKSKKMQLGGWLIAGLGELWFFIASFLFGERNGFFYGEYTIVIASMLFVLGYYLYVLEKNQSLRRDVSHDWLAFYKYITVGALYIYLINISYAMYSNLWGYNHSLVQMIFYKSIIFALITFLLGYVIKRLPLLYTKAFEILITVAYSIVDVLCVVVSGGIDVVGTGGNGFGVVAICLLILYNVIVLLNIRQLVLALLEKKHADYQLYPLWIALYAIGIFTLVMIRQLNLEVWNTGISLGYLVFALGCIILGFKKGWIKQRRLGLILSIIATAKLFLIDISGASVLIRILAFFAFGLILLGISYLYQKFAKATKDEVFLNDKEGEQI